MRAPLALAVLGLVLASGCAAPQGAPAAVDPYHFQVDGYDVGLVRANVTHVPIHWVGHMGMPECASGCDPVPMPDLPPAVSGPGGAGPFFGHALPVDLAPVGRMPTSAERNTTMELRVPGTILWHLNATASWTNLVPTKDGPVQLRYSVQAVSARHPAGRLVKQQTGPSPMHLYFHDLPTDGDESLRFTFERTGSAATVWDLDFNVLGEAIALRPEAEPVPAAPSASTAPAETMPAR